MSKNSLVKISTHAYHAVVKHATIYASEEIPQNDWKIVYGFLCGTILDEDTIIYDSIPMTHGSYNYVEFTVENYLDYAGINNEITDQGLYILGWYHSHPKKGLFLHEVDIINQLNYQQSNPFMIALVIDPTLIKDDSYGIEVFSLKEPKNEYIRTKIKNNLNLPEYYKVKWLIEDELNEFKIEGPIINDLKKKELPH
ncbi:MAG: hypothetical protein ACTSQI_17425 [Candidatus Helarchaeota archaeon]